VTGCQQDGFPEPRVIAEYGPGEGVHSRESPAHESGFAVTPVELDRAFARDLERQFAGDARVHVIHALQLLPYELKRRGIAAAITFSQAFRLAFLRSTRNVRSCERHMTRCTGRQFHYLSSDQ